MALERAFSCAWSCDRFSRVALYGLSSGRECCPYAFCLSHRVQKGFEASLQSPFERLRAYCVAGLELPLLVVAGEQGILDAADQQQRSLCASLLRLRKQADESPEDFVRRRGREAAKCIGPEGKWSLQICKRVVSWHTHVQRDHAMAWGGLFQRHPGRGWLSRLVGRACSGRPRTRFLDGVATAQARIEEHESALVAAVVTAIPRRDFTWLSPAVFLARSSISRFRD